MTGYFNINLFLIDDLTEIDSHIDYNTDIFYIGEF